MHQPICKLSNPKCVVRFMVPVLEMQLAKQLISTKYSCTPPKHSFLPRTVSLWIKMLKEFQNTSFLVSFKLGYK